MEYNMAVEQYEQHRQQHIMLPDGSSSSEKALMWNAYAPESGYSTRAASISSHIQLVDTPSPVHNTNMSDDPLSIDLTVSSSDEPPNQGVADSTTSDEDENNVANWMNSQDNLEMASKAVPDLLKLLVDEDLVVVQEASIILNQMSRMESPREALVRASGALVPVVVNCLYNTADVDTAKNLVGALYGISTQKPEGVRAISFSDALPLLIKLLDAGIESIVSYAITTIHNVLLESGDAVKTQMRKSGAVHHLIPLLVRNRNVKFLAIVVDCLYSLVVHNHEAKTVMLEMGGTQQLIELLFNHTQHYAKLILNIVRLLKVLSVCGKNKQAMLGMNVIQALTNQMATVSSSSSSSSSSSGSIGRDIMQNCLITLRNLSDAATQLPGLAPFITSLLGFLVSPTPSDLNHVEMAAEILSNLTVNEANKIAAVKANAISIFLQLIAHFSGCITLIRMTSSVSQAKIVEPCMCALRHLTIRHAETYAAQEQVRSLHGFGVLASIMRQRPRNWAVLKATLGVVRNLATSPLNSQHMHSYDMLVNLMTVLYDVVQIIQQKSSNNADMRVDGVNLYELAETAAASLLLLAKDDFNKSRMCELDCIGFFVTMLYSPLAGVHSPAASILAELVNAPQCAAVISQQPGLLSFVQTQLRATSDENRGGVLFKCAAAIVANLEKHNLFN